MKMKKALLEAKFTYVNYVKGSAFRIILFIGVILIIGLVNIDSINEFLFADAEKYKAGVYLENQESISAKMIMQAHSELFEYIILNDNKSEENINNLKSRDSIYDVIVKFDENTGKVSFYYESGISAQGMNESAGFMQEAAKVYLLEKEGYDENEISKLVTPNIEFIPFNMVNQSIINLVANMLLFFTIFIYVVHIGNTITEEKTSRIAETLLSYISPLEMLIGKLAGMLGILLTHLASFCIVYLISTSVFQSYALFDSIVSAFNAKTLFMMLCMFIIGYVEYGFLYAANSSFADTVQDIGQASIVQSILIVIAFYFSLILQMHYDSRLAHILIFIPFVSVFSNIVLTAASNISWLMILLVIAVQIIYTVLIGYFCTKRFRYGITKYGAQKRSRKRNVFINSWSNQ
ncbi:ABC transporter permease [Anaerocolumna aminovalerica]|uniref:ABC-type Na+ efflux pump, permease component n=2 Tax=Anaerocolumna aminovalerica TaxID=1527 RepID=A0A1I5F5M7_9FIRM|nr:ABC transporter permease [Anaerocolumna aminovalerica]SFO19055.1 ABC-type Na+ efflux pump, permease component [Anaerocolumna aminovalerica]